MSSMQISSFNGKTQQETTKDFFQICPEEVILPQQINKGSLKNKNKYAVLNSGVSQLITFHALHRLCVWIISEVL